MATLPDSSASANSISLYEASVPVYIRGMKVLENLINDATKHTGSKKMRTDAGLAQARLIADMHPFAFQIIVATNTAKKAVSRMLNDKQFESWEDDETTLEQLQARLAKAVKLLEAQTEEEFTAAEKTRTAPVKFVSSGVRYELSAKEYLLGHGLPNFFFHVTTAYNILRANGVEVGKQDYLGPQLAGRGNIVE
jgi:uncharacterized protein